MLTSVILTNFLSYRLFAYDLVLLMLSFYLLGQLIIPLTIKRNNYYIFIFPYFIFIDGKRFNGTVDFFQRQLGYWPLFWLNGLCGSLLVILISQYFSGKDNLIGDFCQWLGRNTLLILIVHWPIIQWLSYFLYVSGIVKIFDGRMLAMGFWLTGKNRLVVTVELIALLLVYCGVILLILSELIRRIILVFSKPFLARVLLG